MDASPSQLQKLVALGVGYDSRLLGVLRSCGSDFSLVEHATVTEKETRRIPFSIFDVLELAKGSIR